jgi:hypothetical protein
VDKHRYCPYFFGSASVIFNQGTVPITHNIPIKTIDFTGFTATGRHDTSQLSCHACKAFKPAPSVGRTPAFALLFRN